MDPKYIKWAGIAFVVIILVIAIRSYMMQRDARMRAEVTAAAQGQIIEMTRAEIDKAKQDQKQAAEDLKAQLEAIAKQRTIIVTPQQAAAAVPTIVPNLPQPIQVQDVPATPTAPATQNLIIPQADIPAFQAYKLNCDESNARLLACSKDAVSKDAIQKNTEQQLDLMTADRDNWKRAAKGGTFWQRFRHDAIQIGISAAVGYAIGRATQ